MYGDEEMDGWTPLRRLAREQDERLDAGEVLDGNRVIGVAIVVRDEQGAATVVGTRSVRQIVTGIRRTPTRLEMGRAFVPKADAVRIEIDCNLIEIVNLSHERGVWSQVQRFLRIAPEPQAPARLSRARRLADAWDAWWERVREGSGG